MIGLLAPGFLLAGAVAALVPVALHLLARRPPDRRPLPTARFLTPDPRTRLRLRRPAEPLLLALRVLFLLLLGLAFARPEWRPGRSGYDVVVVLDAGVGMAPVWAGAVDAAGAALRTPGATGASLVVFDEVAAVFPAPDDALLDSLRATPPTSRAADYVTGLRGLRAAARGLRGDSAAAVLVTRPRWSAWSGAVPAARAAAWPATLQVISLSDDDERPATTAPGPTPSSPPPPQARESAAPAASLEPPAGPVATVEAPDNHPLRPFALAALHALGYQVGEDAQLSLVLAAAPDAPGTAAAPATRIVMGAADGAAAAAWDRQAEHHPGAGRLVLPDGGYLDGWRPVTGAPRGGASTLAVWEDGRPAAVATGRPGACMAYLAAEPDEPAAAADPDFPRLVRALADGCAGGSVEGRTADNGALDDGAMAVLRGDGRDAVARLAGLAPAPGRSLTRLALALALLVALTETALAYRRRGAS